MRRVIAALVVVGLAVAVVLLWPRTAAENTSDTLAEPTTTTSTSSTLPETTTTTTTTTVPETTSTTAAPDDHVVETVEEAEEILRELWIGWFEGIYNEDEERIREVVVLEETVETARESFGSMEFSQEPQPGLIELASLELLRSDSDCLAVWAELNVGAFRPGATGSEGVYVVRYVDNSWALLSVWPNREDLWEPDCESVL